MKELIEIIKEDEHFVLDKEHPRLDVSPDMHIYLEKFLGKKEDFVELENSQGTDTREIFHIISGTCNDSQIYGGITHLRLQNSFGTEIKGLALIQGLYNDEFTGMPEDQEAGFVFLTEEAKATVGYKPRNGKLDSFTIPLFNEKGFISDVAKEPRFYYGFLNIAFNAFAQQRKFNQTSLYGNLNAALQMGIRAYGQWHKSESTSKLN